MNAVFELKVNSFHGFRSPVKDFFVASGVADRGN